jgi:hypothetical protein
MAITPNTNLRLLKCPIEIDNKNQIKFNSLQAQYNYFNSLPSLNLDDEDISYQRKDSIIAYPEHIDNLLEYNYCMYQNENYTNKWFYCFITDMKYENDGLTYITIKTDVFQTWQFDLTFMKSFVEREHVNDDTVGKNLIPEGLQLGEYICNHKEQWLFDNEYNPWFTPAGNMMIVLGATEKYDESLGDGVLSNGIYSGIRYYLFNTNQTGINVLNSWLRLYAQKSKIEAIKCLFMFPTKLYGTGSITDGQVYAGSNVTETNYINNGESSKQIDFSNMLDNFVPKNNKLKTFPFCYLLVSNNSGSDVIYRYEDFYTINNEEKEIETPSFRIDSCITPSGSIRMIPRNYKGIIENDIEGINMGKFPICNWDTDVYTNWLTQNGVNIGLSVARFCVKYNGQCSYRKPYSVLLQAFLELQILWVKFIKKA